jgi:hypothetical protein
LLLNGLEGMATCATAAASLEPAHNPTRSTRYNRGGEGKQEASLVLDPIVSLALAIQSSPGVYALLIGSGVSRAAEIPTGWEIVLDLIGKLAVAAEEDPEPDPEAWFRSKFGEDPDYSKLLASLAKTPGERTSRLRAYFEPTEEERTRGAKSPTQAHRAIARLVRLGYVKMILTTNFDRLIETALQDEGIAPNVISTADAVRGAVPVVHSGCVVAKLHGDYQDTRLRNTDQELSRYPAVWNRFLSRVIDEYGLIICGWSAEWDKALRDAIIRCPSRRYSTYWLARGAPTDEAQRLVQHRRAITVPITDAETFLPQLADKVEALHDMDRPHPLSTRLAIAEVKRLTPDPLQRIRLNDLIMPEVGVLRSELTPERVNPHAGPVNGTTVGQRLTIYEAKCERLASMLATLAHHDHGLHSHFYPRIIEALVKMEALGGYTAWLQLRYYPALLVTYAAGIAAVVNDRVDNLAAMTLRPDAVDPASSVKTKAVTLLTARSVLGHVAEVLPYPDTRKIARMSLHLLRTLRPWLGDVIAADQEYRSAFDTYEYLLSMVCLDLAADLGWPPLGLFAWESPFPSAANEPVPPWITRMKSPLLQAGFFGQNEQQFEEILAHHEQRVVEARAQWAW